MKIITLTIAKKYAEAYVNCYGHNLDLEEINRIDQAADFIISRRSALALFSVPLLTSNQVQQALEQVLSAYRLPKEFSRLYTILFNRKKILLIADVFKQIVAVYRARHNIMHVSMQSSAPLSETQITSLQKFIANHTKKAIVYHTELNHELIAGIRLQSDSILWEHSVAKALREISKVLGQ